ncbi:oligosaccharide repeat unit polymerase [bacterium]|nr:oligosaccharide repeat unit polymerase [bacterium]
MSLNSSGFSKGKAAAAAAAVAAAASGVLFAFLCGSLFSGLFVTLLAVYTVLIFRKSDDDYGVMSPRRVFLLLYLGYGIVPFFSVLFRHSDFYQERYAPLLSIFHRYLDNPLPALLMILAGLIAFEAGYSVSLRPRKVPADIAGTGALLWTSIVFYGVTALFFGKLVLFIMQRLSVFSFLNYSELYEMLGAPSYLVGIGLGWFSVAIVILYVASHIGNKKILRIVALASLAAFVVFCVLMGKRRIVVTTLLALVLFRHYYIKRIPRWVVTAMFLLGTWFVNLVANLRILNIVSRRYLELVMDVVRSLNPLEALINLSVISEFQMPFGTFLTLTNRVPSREPFMAGESYLKAPLVMIPRSLMENRWDGLGPWFVDHFFPQYKGTGFAFFILGEPYLNFGIVGVILFMVFFGMTMKLLAGLLKENRERPFAVLLISYAVAFMFSFIRMDIVCLRELMYTFILPVILVLVIANMLVRLNEHIILR